MRGEIVFLNGEYIEESKAKVSIYDRGFLWGDAVYDIGRTFNHIPFKLKEHTDRLFRSLRYTQIDPFMTPQDVCAITLKVIKRNQHNWAPNDDYLYVQMISRGGSYSLSVDPAVAVKPGVLIQCRRIAFETFAQKYVEGVHLIETPVRHIPSQCLDPRAKVRSRMVNFLADLEVKKIDPSAFALMLDVNGFLTEGPSFNFFMVKGGKLLTPRGCDVLEGITRQTILELAKRLGIESHETDLTLYDLYNADEVIITATSFEILPVSKLNNKPLEGPIPGPIAKQLLSALSKLVGVDIVQQAQGMEGTGANVGEFAR